jgi:hypothetical protein
MRQCGPFIWEILRRFPQGFREIGTTSTALSKILAIMQAGSWIVAAIIAYFIAQPDFIREYSISMESARFKSCGAPN